MAHLDLWLTNTKYLLHVGIPVFKGTTWLQEIVWQIFHNGETSTKKINNRVPFLEDSKLLNRTGTDCHTALETLPSPRLMKSHLPYHLIPKADSKASECKYIYIARNPKDVAVSFYNFLTDFGEKISGFQGPWEFYAKLFLQGKGKEIKTKIEILMDGRLS